MTLKKTAEQQLADIHAFVDAKITEYDNLHKEHKKEVQVLHGRINSATRWFTGLLLTMNTAWGSALAYIKLRG